MTAPLLNCELCGQPSESFREVSVSGMWHMACPKCCASDDRITYDAEGPYLNGNGLINLAGDTLPAELDDPRDV